jgi:probable phosphoglycerate mutase
VTDAQHIVLVRHGESAWNAIGRLQGQADAPLSERGREQARALRDTLAALPPMGLITSDLSRARDTGVLAGFDGAEEDARWRERSLGVWEGRIETDVPADELRAFRERDHVPAGGEHWAELQARVGAALEELAGRGGSSLVFTHGGCVRAAVAYLTGADPSTIAGPGNTSLTLLEIGRRRRVQAFNWTASSDGRAQIPQGSDPGGAELEVSDPPDARGNGAGGASGDHAKS